MQLSFELVDSVSVVYFYFKIWIARLNAWNITAGKLAVYKITFQ